jgi:hypothetical protein
VLDIRDDNVDEPPVLVVENVSRPGAAGGRDVTR